MSQRKLSQNIALVTLKNAIAMIGPLIIWPYVTRVLEVENIGKITFVESTVGYFVLLAGLGISNYAIREASAFRDDKERLSQFVSEVFSINLLATLVSYLLLSICCFTIHSFYANRYLLLIYSTGILFNTLSLDWLFTIEEDYLYLTIRSIVKEILLISLVFLFVRGKDDYYIYILISVGSACILNLCNFIQTRRWCRIRFTLRCNWKIHRKPILTMFAGAIAISIYVRSDNVLLGMLSTEYHLGLYAASTQIYSAVKTCIAVLINVSMPRLAYYAGNTQNEDYQHLWNKLLTIVASVLFPSVIGLLLIGNQVITLISGHSFAPAGSSMRILSVALIPSLIGWVFVHGALTINKGEKHVLQATAYGGIANIVLNILLIPHYHEVAAAATTLLAEFIAMSTGMYYGLRVVKVKLRMNDCIGILLGCIFIGVFGLLVKWLSLRWNLPDYAEIAICVLGSMLGYTGIMIKADSSLWREVRNYRFW